MRVREDEVEFSNGLQGIYGVVERPDFVAIVPIDAKGCIHLVQQYRYPVSGRFWEIPQGSWEEISNPDPEQLALAELLEETGLRAGRLTCVGHLFEACGYSNQGYHLFVATDLVPGLPKLEATECDMVSKSFPITEVKRMIADGQIKDGTTVAALGYLLLATEFSDILK